MAVNFLDFEQPIAELEAKIEELGHVTSDGEVNIQDEMARLRAKSRQLTTSIFSQLTPWQITQLARHPQRPYTLDYIARLCTDFEELHGDRMYGDDAAIVGGIARLDGRPIMVIGQQKGRDTKERVRRNYGMPKPEGYRKALRLMRTAERFGLPIVTFIDTPGAYPGVSSEERGQSEAIARNLFEMATLRVPIVSIVIGEGGSGGALAIGVCPAGHAAVLGLLGHLTRGLRFHCVEERRQERSRSRRHGHYRRATAKASAGRRSSQRAAGWRASRPGSGLRAGQGLFDPPSRCPVRTVHRGAGGPAAGPFSKLRRLH